MKNLAKGMICLSVFLVSLKLSAQNPPVREPDMNRPSLFQNLPEKITCRVNDLSGLLQSEVGNTVSFSFTENTNFQGVVSSVATKFENTLQSVVIRSTNFPGAALSFSKLTKEDGTVAYIGRIISFQHGDAYEITMENGQYYFIKKGFYDLVNE
ncbi:MAG TPA: hypothetical protein VFP97_07300 [Chitinophagaceae bacterium]|nr:hypothetical protein [Chitinophagaceae bacterium]